MVRAPLMAHRVPTSFPIPEVGKMSPYLCREFESMAAAHPTVVMVITTQ